MKFLLSLAAANTLHTSEVGLTLMAFIVAMGLAPGAQAQYYKCTSLDTFTGFQRRFFRTQW